MNPSDLCPCGRTDPRGRGRTFGGCCEPWLAGAAAPDAESLMRSRYSAYVLDDTAYLLATWHADTRPAQVRSEPGTRWLGLQVREHRVTDTTHAQVEFVARMRVRGKGSRLHEVSRFTLEADGRWYYLDGLAR